LERVEIIYGDLLKRSRKCSWFHKCVAGKKVYLNMIALRDGVLWLWGTSGIFRLYCLSHRWSENSTALPTTNGKDLTGVQSWLWFNVLWFVTATLIKIVFM